MDLLEYYNKIDVKQFFQILLNQRDNFINSILIYLKISLLYHQL